MKKQQTENIGKHRIQRKDHILKRSLSPEQVKIQAVETIDRMLSVMGMRRNIELTRFIGCHRNEVAKWRRKGVPFPIVNLIGLEANVTIDFLLYGALPKFDVNNQTRKGINELIQESLELGADMMLINEQREGGYDIVADKIAIDLVKYIKTVKVSLNRD